MSPSSKRFVVYLRVSTQKQGASGLGIEAQQKAVSDYLTARGGTVIATYKEIESGKVNERPQLQAALKRCRQTRSALLVAKLDRLSRDKVFMFTLRATPGVKLIFADLPDANEMSLDMMTLMASYEREAISARTKAALAAAKARGARLGNPHLQPGNAASAAVASQAMQQKAKDRAEDLRDVVEAALADGLPITKLAEHLNSLGCTTPRGSTWTTPAVYRLLAHLGLHQPQKRSPEPRGALPEAQPGEAA